MTTLTLTISGMTCGHCVTGVTHALKALEGVTVDEVTIGSARVHFDEQLTTPAQLTQAIEEDGYGVVSAA